MIRNHLQPLHSSVGILASSTTRTLGPYQIEQRKKVSRRFRLNLTEGPINLIAELGETCRLHGASRTCSAAQLLLHLLANLPPSPSIRLGRVTAGPDYKHQSHLSIMFRFHRVSFLVRADCMRCASILLRPTSSRCLRNRRWCLKSAALVS